MVEREFIKDVGYFHTLTAIHGGRLVCIYGMSLKKVKEKWDEISNGLHRTQQEGIQEAV